jgi:hypothetical protein
MSPQAATTTATHQVDIYKIAAKRTWVGEIEAAEEREAIEKAAKEFKRPATKLMAVKRPLSARLQRS